MPVVRGVTSIYYAVSLQSTILAMTTVFAASRRGPVVHDRVDLAVPFLGPINITAD